MAKQVVAFEITTDSKQAEASVGSFKKQLKEANNELFSMTAQFGEASIEAVNAAKKVAGLKDAIGDAKALADTFNPDKKFVALGGALQGATAGFSALQGAMGLFGDENKDLEKTLLKVQSAMALQQGISGLYEARDAFGLLKDGAVRAFQAIKGAIGATGIGLLVIALGSIVAYWDEIKGAVSGVSEEQKKLTKASQENLAAEKEKLNEIGSQDNVLKLQGKSEREILMMKKNQVVAVIKATEATMLQDKITTKAQVEAATRNQQLLKGLLDLVFLPQKLLFEYSSIAINKLIGLLNKIPGIKIDFKINEQLADNATDFISKLVFDPEAIQKKADDAAKANENAIKKLQNDSAGYQLSVNAIDKQAKENAFVDTMKGLEKSKIETELIEGATAAARVGINANAANQIAEQTRLTEAQLSEIRRKSAEEDAKDSEIARDAKIKATSDTLNIVSDILGKESAAGKAIAISGALINTYLGISAGVKLGYPAAIPAVLAAAATGFKAVKNIIGTKIPGKASGGGSAAGGSMSAPSLSSSTAPIKPQAQTTTLSTQSINQIGVASSRAYVLESDVSSNQERSQRLNRAARIN
jgi:hypothetical protein